MLFDWYTYHISVILTIEYVCNGQHIRVIWP
jgi:hypothetical protein